MTEQEQVRGVLALARLEGAEIKRGQWQPAMALARQIVPGWASYPMAQRLAFLQKVWACVKTTAR